MRGVSLVNLLFEAWSLSETRAHQLVDWSVILLSLRAHLLNLGPQACMANTLPTESSPSPNNFYIIAYLHS